MCNTFPGGVPRARPKSNSFVMKVTLLGNIFFVHVRMFPAKLKKDNEFWNTIMDTEDIKNQLRSLDGCATAAYLAKSPFQERLLRPFVREYVLYCIFLELFVFLHHFFRKDTARASFFFNWCNTVITHFFSSSFGIPFGADPL